MKPLLALATSVAALSTIAVTTTGPAPATAAPRPSGTSAAATPSTTRPATAPTTGDAPRIPYREAQRVRADSGSWRLVSPDGTRRRLDRTTVQEFAVAGDAVVSTYDSGEVGVVVHVERAGGAGRARVGLDHLGLVTTPDHSVVGYLDNRERFVALEAGGRHQVRLGRVPGVVRPGAVLGSATCREAEPEGGGCTAFLDRPRDGGAMYTSSHGITDAVPELLTVTDANQRGRLAGLTSVDPYCHGVLVNARRVAWRTCEHTLEAFSPDGRRLLGVSRAANGDALDVALYRGDGRVLTAWAPDAGARVTDVEWEDSRHVLAVVFQDGSWSILRIGVDGTVERTTAGLDGVRSRPKLQLPIR